MITEREYAEMEDKIERLEKALDKACEALHCGQYENDDRNLYSKEQWKEWCMKYV